MTDFEHGHPFPDTTTVINGIRYSVVDRCMVRYAKPETEAERKDRVAKGLPAPTFGFIAGRIDRGQG